MTCEGAAFAGRPSESPMGDPNIHAAIQAWDRLEVRRISPMSAETLKESPRFSAYRLRNAGFEGADVIGMRCRRRRAVVERWVYEQLLPQAGVSVLRFYGEMAEADGLMHWLFVEDASGRPYLPGDPACRAVAARWLGAFHVAAAMRAQDAADTALPSHGVDYYEGLLRSALDSLRRCRRDVVRAPSPGDQYMSALDALTARCEAVASRWDQVRRACERVPLTIVHGDFADRNLRVRDGDYQIAGYRRAPAGGYAASQLVLYPFDWEDAAWGPPAIDLIQDDTDRTYDAANADLSVYLDTVTPYWPGLDENAIRTLSEIGRLFWLILAIQQDSTCVAPEWIEQRLRNFQLYADGLAQAFGMLGWKP
ncbi:MAG: hypothetical protein JWN51_248 [Phycisphaerales bacterium]|nr:hypothetical protein [Phycisphaerales bacterium]